MVEQIESFLSSLAELQEAIKKNKSAFVSRAALKEQTQKCCKLWLGKLSTQIRGRGLIEDQILNIIDEKFERLIELAENTNRKKSYIALLSIIPKEIQKTVLIPLIKKAQSSQNPLTVTILSKIYSNINSEEEKKFFEEAATAAASECYKAATVMVWCVVIDRLRRVVEKLGLISFNSESKKLNTRKTGFYKRFSKEFNISQTNELQEIFDKDLITVLSSMVNLDLNELKAIIYLFDIRNSCAHPSSFIMDELAYINYINEALKLVLSNPKFKCD